MFRSIKIHSNPTRQILPTCRSTITLATFSFVLAFSCFSFQYAFSSESARYETVQTIETPLGLIKVEKNVAPQALETLSPLDLTVKFQKPKEVAVAEDDLAGIYGDFNVKFLGDETHELDEKTNETSRRWRLYPRRRGELSLPPIPISLSYSLPRTPSEQETVVALLPNQVFKVPESDPPLKSVEDIQIDRSPIRQFPTLVTVVTLAIATGLGFITFFLFSKRKSAVSTPRPQIEAPYDKAVRRLGELKNSPLYLQNDRLFYIQIDDILREYLTDVFILNAQEMTSQEITQILDQPEPMVAAPSSLDYGSDSNLADLPSDISEREKTSIAVATLKTPEIRSALETALTTLDLVKFANQPTSFNDASQIYSNISRLIERSFSTYSELIDEARRALIQHENVPNGTPQGIDANSSSITK